MYVFSRNYPHSGHSNLPLPKRNRIWRYSNLSSIKYKPLVFTFHQISKGSNLALIANEYAKETPTTTSRHGRPMSGIKSPSFDLYNRPVVGTPANAAPRFSGHLHLGNYSRAESRLAHSTQKTRARAHTRPVYPASTFGVDATSHSQQRGEKSKREEKKHTRPTDRHESVRSLGISAMYGGKKKRGRGSPTEEMILHTPLVHPRSESKEGCTRNA